MSSKRQRVYIKPRFRVVKPTAIIIGDGQTEEEYFIKLKKINFFSNVNLKFEIGNESNFTTKLKEHYNKNIYLIIDVDNAKKDSTKFNRIKGLIEKYPKKIYFNNYSFELWLINHKQKFTKPVIKKEEYDKKIEEHFKVSSWSKSKTKRKRKKIVDLIDSNNIEFACLNIKEINKKNFSENPSSNMDEFIESIKKIKK